MIIQQSKSKFVNNSIHNYNESQSNQVNIRSKSINNLNNPSKNKITTEKDLKIFLPNTKLDFEKIKYDVKPPKTNRSKYNDTKKIEFKPNTASTYIKSKSKDVLNSNKRNNNVNELKEYIKTNGINKRATTDMKNAIKHNENTNIINKTKVIGRVINEKSKEKPKELYSNTNLFNQIAKPSYQVNNLHKYNSTTNTIKTTKFNTNNNTKRDNNYTDNSPKTKNNTLFPTIKKNLTNKPSQKFSMIKKSDPFSNSQKHKT